MYCRFFVVPTKNRDWAAALMIVVCPGFELSLFADVEVPSSLREF